MFLAMPPVVVPDAVVRERSAYYEVVGSHEEALVRELNAKGPTKPDGTYWAYTDAEISWTYDPRMAGSTCMLSKPVVVISINTTLPAWKPPAGVETKVVGKWNVMFKALKSHENEHAQFTRDAGKALIALMREHPADTTCEQLDTYLQARGRDILNEEKKRNIDLDARTGHGRSEGVGISW